MLPWLLAIRPKTLSAAVAPVLAGTALAYAELKRVSWIVFIFALLGALFIQIGTNLVNDLLDFRRGADTAKRLGPVRVTQAGLITPAAIRRAAWLSFMLATLCGIPLILRGGLPILAIGVASIVAAYAYTGGPYPLAYHGLGEIFVILFFGIVAVGGTYYLHTFSLTWWAVLVGIAIGSLATVLLAINNLRDLEEDRQAGKRTMAVRLGDRRARMEVAMFAVIPFVLILALATRRPILGAPLLLLPLAIVLVDRVRHSQGAALNRCLALAGALELGFALTFAAGAVMDVWRSGTGITS